ncbi:uncharacterized protein [Antedon mediterranea]|uniref:uncharacterized protein isoform X2 n=1 Tax=Antedon mediterranea TaxID=105859 RepID=UPI003AF87152
MACDSTDTRSPLSEKNGNVNWTIKKTNEISKVLEFIFLLQTQYKNSRGSVLSINMIEDATISSATTMCCIVEIKGDGEWTQHFDVEQLFTGEIEPLLSVILATVGTFEIDVKVHEENQMRHANVSVEDGDDIAIKFSQTDCTGDENDFYCKYLIVITRKNLLQLLVELKSYIHSVFVLNNLPLVGLNIETSQHSEKTMFGREAKNCINCCGRRIVTDAFYFRRVTSSEISEHTRVCHNASPKFLLTCPVLSSGDQPSLKLFVSAITLPSAENQTSKTLNIYFFGPGGLPFGFQSVSQCNVLPFQLAKWEEFGLQVGQQVQRHNSNHGLVLPDQSYHIIRTSDSLCSNEWQTLQVLVLIDYNTHHSIVEKKEILDAIRSNLSTLVTNQADKFKRATHRALNKLWMNKSKSRDKQKILEQAIPVTVKAIGCVFKHSTNEEFRRRCLDKLKVSNSRELQAEMTARLWCIAKRRFGVMQPNTSGCKRASSTKHSSSNCSQVSHVSDDATSFDEFGDIGLLVWDQMTELADDVVHNSELGIQESEDTENTASETLTNDDWFSQALTECDWLNVPEPEE